MPHPILLIIISKIKETGNIHLATDHMEDLEIKSTIFWDITPCSPVSDNRRFGGTYRLHLQGRNNKLSKKPAWKKVASRIIRQLEIQVFIGNRREVYVSSIFINKLTSLLFPIKTRIYGWRIILLSRWFLAQLIFFDSEGGDMFLRNVGWHSTAYTVLCPRRCYSS
jgi:hypothetical protein